MPCFKGLAVSIHTPNGPLPEYSIQKQSRQNRIASYIPVPAPKFTPGSDRPEQSTFAISITLLNPGSAVPYSSPTPTAEDPTPRPKIVGALPSLQSQRGQYDSVVGPYIPVTSNPNETVAAYIHFDGRPKEEVATLLRRGVETWVNSRWVGVPAAEGGGLAEREFLFREVGLERWLNGLDLQGEGKDVAARIQKRKEKMERKRRRKLLSRDSEDEDDKVAIGRARPVERNGVLRYGGNKSSPVEDVSGDDGTLSSSAESEDEMPEPEATGQIKVSLFRVMASGEIKKGEYSPSFDAHDDDDEGMQGQGEDPGVDHTTTFAKPKTLDPKSISTQTVTGIDDPNRPYATFTFFYRGEKQLQKMGILPNTEPTDKKTSVPKRKSRQLDFSNLGPLKAKEGTVGFAGYRDNQKRPSVSKGKNGQLLRNADDMDSDNEEEPPLSPGKQEKPGVAPGAGGDVVADAEEDENMELTPEELAKRAELADGVKKMQLKRQHSFDPSQNKPAEKSPQLESAASPVTSAADPASHLSPTTSIPPLSAARLTQPEVTASPYKKQRASVASGDGGKLFPSSQPSPDSTSFTGGPSPDVIFSANQNHAQDASQPRMAVEEPELKGNENVGPSPSTVSNGETKQAPASVDKDGDEEL